MPNATSKLPNLSLSLSIRFDETDTPSDASNGDNDDNDPYPPIIRLRLQPFDAGTLQECSQTTGWMEGGGMEREISPADLWGPYHVVPRERALTVSIVRTRHTHGNMQGETHGTL